MSPLFGVAINCAESENSLFWISLILQLIDNKVFKLVYPNDSTQLVDALDQVFLISQPPAWTPSQGSGPLGTMLWTPRLLVEKKGAPLIRADCAHLTRELAEFCF